MSRRKAAFVEILAVLLLLQGIKFILESLFSPILSGTRFAEKMLTMCVMLLLTGAVMLYAKLRKAKLSVLPKQFSKQHLLFTAVAAALYIAAPSNYTVGFTAIMTLIYASIVTPIYEELLFRGFIWDRLDPLVKGKYTTCMLTSILFGVWHIGYMIPQLLDGNPFAVLSKVAVGLGYGFVLGFVRLKTGTCYTAILLHGIMNLFAF